MRSQVVQKLVRIRRRVTGLDEKCGLVAARLPDEQILRQLFRGDRCVCGQFTLQDSGEAGADVHLAPKYAVDFRESCPMPENNDTGRIFASKARIYDCIQKMSDKLELNIDMRRKPSRTISKAGWVEA